MINYKTIVYPTLQLLLIVYCMVNFLTDLDFRRDKSVDIANLIISINNFKSEQKNDYSKKKTKRSDNRLRNNRR